MDVQCERCKTEYEFDDALVSARGTTVKCTNCGFQFKIRPAGAAAEAERWVVDSVGGQRLVFTSLRELQKAITNRQVGRGDTLSRGNAPPRTLGSIAELEPFFAEAGAAAAPKPGAAAVARDGSPAGPSFPRRPPQVDFEPPTSPMASTVAAANVATPAPPMLRPPSAPAAQELPPARPRLDTLRPQSEMGAAPPPPAPVARLAPVEQSLQPAPPPPPPPQHLATERAGTERGLGPSIHEKPTTVSPAVGMPPPTNPVRRPLYDELDVSEPIRVTSPSISDSEPIYGVPRRRRVGGWVIAAVVLAGASFIGYKAFAPYLAALNKTQAAPPPLDARAQGFLNDGERALADGNLDAAKENFDKASALAEKDPHVLLDVARLSAARADVPWLRLRLLPPDAADDIRTAKQSLDDLSAGARKAADAALAAAPDDAAALRAKVDALRINGEREAARGLVVKIIGSAAQPETAYVLAALDLSELDPLWPTVVDRLRVAAAGEGNAGRARAALVYALSRAGDATGAKTELDKLAALPRPYPLLGALRAFVLKLPSGAVPDAGAPAASAKSSAPAAPSGPVSVSSLPKDTGGGGGGVSGDPRVLIQQAEAARTRGDYERAKMLYESALGKNPNDSQALAGLGDVAYGQHDNGSAKSFYQRALANNPNYLPALVGIADVEWQEGDRDRAQKAYKDIVDRFPDGTYPARCRQRAEGGSSPPGGSTGSSQQLTVPANTPSDLPGNSP